MVKEQIFMRKITHNFSMKNGWFGRIGGIMAMLCLLGLNDRCSAEPTPNVRYSQGATTLTWTMPESGSELDKATSLDSWLRTLAVGTAEAPATITFSTGTFPTRGYYNYLIYHGDYGYALKSYWTIQGQGAGTIIKLVDIGLSSAIGGGCNTVFSNGVYAQGDALVTHVCVQDMTIDGNYRQLKEAKGTDQLQIQAVSLHGGQGTTDLVIRNIHVIGAAGRRNHGDGTGPAGEAESFTLWIRDNEDIYTTQMNHNRIENCVVDGFADSSGYISAIAMASGTASTDNLITGCTVTFPSSFNPSYDQFYAYNPGASSGLTLANNFAKYATRAVNDDTPPVSELTIENNRFENSYAGIFVCEESSESSARNNYISVIDGGTGIMVGRFENNPTAPSHWTISNNTIERVSGSSLAYGIYATRYSANPGTDWTQATSITGNKIDATLHNKVDISQTYQYLCGNRSDYCCTTEANNASDFADTSCGGNGGGGRDKGTSAESNLKNRFASTEQ
jgi:hypothetical protein